MKTVTDFGNGLVLSNEYDDYDEARADLQKVSNATGLSFSLWGLDDEYVLDMKRTKKNEWFFKKGYKWQISSGCFGLDQRAETIEPENKYVLKPLVKVKNKKREMEVWRAKSWLYDCGYVYTIDSDSWCLMMAKMKGWKGMKE
jgi:hypothetical protein